jgi:[ribosomal protein S5]-alanine N-acetyltransferase
MNYLLTNQETDRLKFRKLEHSDFDFWVELFKDEITTQFLGMSEFKTANQCCEEWFNWTFHRYDNNLGGQNIMILKENNEIVGQSGLLVREINNTFELEIAYSILPKYRQQGFAIEGAQKCKDFAFENNFHNRLISMIFPNNINSKNVAVKNGMTLNRIELYNDKKMEIYQISKIDWINSNLV